MANEEQWVPLDAAPISKRSLQRLAKAGLIEVRRIQLEQDKMEKRAAVMARQIDDILATLRAGRKRHSNGIRE